MQRGACTARPSAGRRGSRGRRPRSARGATASGSAWLAAQLPELGAGDDVVVVVAPDDAAARRLEADIRFFRGGAGDPAAALDDIAALPGIDVSPYADLSPDRSGIVERVATLYRL